MRLTLRTMLAFLDGILAPEDAESIGKKIEESTYASDLIHRIRDLLRRPSSSAEDAESGGSGLGPNTMAEYLDNTLAPTRVTEFEKICLETDAHLAEVAACHQILTLVLGEPAEIDPASRQRMYDISAKLAAETISFSGEQQNNLNTVIPPPFPVASSTEPESDEKDEGTDRKREKPVIPDYLREPAKNNRWISILTAAFVAVCLLSVLLWLLGRFEPGTTMGDMLVGVGLVQDGRKVASETNKKPPVRNSQTEISVAQKPSPKPVVSESKTPAPAIVQAASPALPETKTSNDSASDTQPSETSTPGKTETVSTTEKAGPQAEIPAKTEATETATKTEGEAPIAAQTVDTGSSKTGTIAVDNTSSNAPQPSADKNVEIVAISSETKPPREKTAAPSERIGRYTSDDQILLINFVTPAVWQRAENKEFLTSNEQLLALPTYHPEIAIGTDVGLQMLSSTQLELLPANAQEPAGIKIRFGRIIAKPLANAGTRLRIVVGDRPGVITFTDPESIVAANVRRIHSKGANPESETARFATEVYVVSGRVLWDETAQKTLEIAAPARFITIDQSPPELTSAKDFPPWVTGESAPKQESRSSPEIRASATIGKILMDLPANRPALRGLMELAEHRQKEVRWLAIRSLAFLGYFDPMVTILDNAESKLEWNDNIDQLCKAVVRDPSAGLAVRQSLENRYPGPVAANMYRMLWGYSDEGLTSGDDGALVASLEDENLPIRVLGLWNLKEITGKSQYYQPELIAAKRQQPVKNWKKSLENKEIRNKTAEEKGGNALREGFQTVD